MPRESSSTNNPGGVYPRDLCVLRYALERHAAERPQDVYAVFDDGDQWTFSQTLEHVRRVAAGLHSAGVGKGDRVLIALPNCALAIKAILAANYLGAVCVPVNPALKGGLLEHVVTDSQATVAIVHEALVEAVDAIDAPCLKTIFSSGSHTASTGASGRALLPAAQLELPWSEEMAPQEPVEPWHTQAIIYTSGTTGRSKGVLASYMHSYSTASTDTWTATRSTDRHLLHMPVFHIGGTFIASAALCVGSSIAVVGAFRTDSFWETIRSLNVTVAFLLGAMATFLLKAPPKPDDRDHPLRMVYIVPLGQSGPEFRERFGVDVYTLFNMTEISTPLLSSANPTKPNLCGRPRDGVEVRLVDDNDCEVPVGATGQLIVRTARPWAMNHGYHNNPGATAEAWRNGWFHTGDAFMRDEDGDYFFVDRMKDAIRRRGENISSFEIEVEVLTHPDVREAAAVAVPSEHTEDEVLVIVSPAPGRKIDPVALTGHLCTRVAHHMVPRYIRVMEDLPKTPTAKIQKHLLRQEGVTSDTWDREKAGLTIRRERFEI